MAEVCFPMSRVADITLPPSGLWPCVRLTMAEESVLIQEPHLPIPEQGSVLEVLQGTRLCKDLAILYIAYLKIPKSKQPFVLLNCSWPIFLSNSVMLQRYCVSPPQFFSSIDDNKEKWKQTIQALTENHLKSKLVTLQLHVNKLVLHYD